MYTAKQLIKNQVERVLNYSTMQILEGIVTEYLLFTATNRPSEWDKTKIIEFLHVNLGDIEPHKEHIRRSLEYATKEQLSFGGFIVVYKNYSDIVAVAVVNHTGMQGYMAENVLVYLAVDEKHRNQGIAKKLISSVLNYAKGDVALHLKGDSSLGQICEKFGFQQTIVEMRLAR